jgi:hypothetical protein
MPKDYAIAPKVAGRSGNEYIDAYEDALEVYVTVHGSMPRA